MNTRISRTVAVVAGCAILLTGCGGGQGGTVPDKAGSETVSLHMATSDGAVNGNGVSYGPEAFVKGLKDVSNGHFTVDVTEDYGDGNVNSEAMIIKAMQDGTLDGGWPSVRSFAQAGIKGLGAVEAPMMITSHAAMNELVAGPVADKLLAKTTGSGVVGLGLTVEALRRPFASGSPLLGPEDWSGVRFRTFDSPVQSDTITALGGTPVNVGDGWNDQVRKGTLRGAEFDIPQYHSNGYGADAPFVTANVVLWPKVLVLSISQKRFDALSDEQRDWIRAAAKAATKASVDGSSDEDGIAVGLCDRGVRFISASADQVAALRTKVAPVIDRLAADPADGPILADVQAIAKEHPGVDVVEVPEGCRQATVAGKTEVPTQASKLPDGTYRQEVNLDEVKAAGTGNGPGWTGTWTLKVEDGTYALTCRVIDDPVVDCGQSGGQGEVLEAGYLRGEGDRVWFVGDSEILARLQGCKLPASDEPGHCFVLGPYSFTWSLDGDRLTLSDPDPAEAVGFTIEPLQKID